MIIERLPILVCLPLLLAIAPLAHFHCADQTGSLPENRELLHDPSFVHGITQGFANHLPPAERVDCLKRWAEKGVHNAEWLFWEISEQLYFAHNPSTPTIKDPGQFLWTTANGAKQCLINDGDVHFRFDTSKEWREGGNLSMPDNEGHLPKYGNPKTNWPHYLIGQQLNVSEDNSSQGKQAPLRFDSFQKLRFNADVKLNHLLKNSVRDYLPDYRVRDHAIFYIGFTIRPIVPPPALTGTFYVLVPAIYSYGDNKNVAGSSPWLGIDQHGAGVYYSDSQPSLRLDAWVHYDIDIKQLIRDAFLAAEKEAVKQNLPRSLRAEDYLIDVVLIGWEVWGGFDTDVEFKNLSLRGGP